VALRRDVASVALRAGFEQLAAPLVTTEEIPVWLECIDWSLDEGGELTVQAFNFRGGCGVTWTGQSVVSEDGTLRIELENANPGCAIAGCGNCTYDARGTFLLDDALSDGELPFTLARLPCDGSNGRDSDWLLPVGSSPAGTRCVPADPDGAAKADYNGAGRADALFAPCTLEATADPDLYPTPLTACGDGLSCVEEHCVVACASDADCPLRGALGCQGGYCQLVE
jgi:hypothetical protein